jgi:hypothetical protein
MSRLNNALVVHHVAKKCENCLDFERLHSWFAEHGEEPTYLAAMDKELGATEASDQGRIAALYRSTAPSDYAKTQHSKIHRGGHWAPFTREDCALDLEAAKARP